MPKFTTTAILFGVQCPANVVDQDDQVADDQVVIGAYKGPTPTTTDTMSDYMIGYVVDSELSPASALAVEDIPQTYRREYKQAREKWAKFSAWLVKQGVKVETPRLYIVTL